VLSALCFVCVCVCVCVCEQATDMAEMVNRWWQPDFTKLTEMASIGGWWLLYRRLAPALSIEAKLVGGILVRILTSCMYVSDARGTFFRQHLILASILYSMLAKLEHLVLQFGQHRGQIGWGDSDICVLAVGQCGLPRCTRECT
jgi:hypothetical protein